MVLTAFSDLVAEAREHVRQDIVVTGVPDDGVPLWDGGMGATAYADAVGVYLGMAVSKETAFLDDASFVVPSWRGQHDSASIGTFGSARRLPMVWDYAEAKSVFAGAGRRFGRMA